MLGIWVNVDSRVFDNAPAYLAVLANRPLDASPTPRRCDGCSSASTISSCRSAPPRPSPIRRRRSVPRRLPASCRATQRLYQRGDQRRHVPDARPCSAPRFRCRPRCRSATTRSTCGCSPTAPSIARTHSAFEVYKAGFEQFVTQRRARPRLALRPRHRHDGAADRLVRQRGVPAGLMRSVRVRRSAVRLIAQQRLAVTDRRGPRPACAR